MNTLGGTNAMQPPEGMIRLLEIHEKNKETGMVEVRYAAPGHELAGCFPPDDVVYRYPIGEVGFIDCYPMILQKSAYPSPAAFAMQKTLFDVFQRMQSMTFTAAEASCLLLAVGCIRDAVYLGCPEISPHWFHRHTAKDADSHDSAEEQVGHA